MLIDFGCSRRLADEDLLLVVTRAERQRLQLWGNASHIAPELHLELSRANADDSTARLSFKGQSVFELGVLAIEMCAGEHPVQDYPQCLEFGDYDAHVPEGTPYPDRLVHLMTSMVRAACCPPACHRLTYDPGALCGIS